MCKHEWFEVCLKFYCKKYTIKLNWQGKNVWGAQHRGSIALLGINGHSLSGEGMIGTGGHVWLPAEAFR